jgi:hypothetical protein
MSAARASAARRRVGAAAGRGAGTGDRPDAATTRYGALAVPAPVRVLTAPDGTPRSVEIDGRRRAVEAVRDDWLVQDLWWTDRPVERHYHELVVHPGRVVVVYHDLLTQRWHRH